MRLGSIRAKLGAAFGVILLVLLLVGVIGWLQTHDTADALETLYGDHVVPLEQLSNVEQGLYELRVSGTQYLTADAATRTRLRGSDATWRKDVDDNMARYGATSLDADEQAGLRDWRDAFPAYLAARDRFLSLADAGRTDEAAQAQADATPQFQRSLDVAERLLSIQVKTAEDLYRTTRSRATIAQVVIVVGSLIALALATLLGYLLARNIGGTAREVASVARGLAAGDLRGRVQANASADELGQMARAFAEATENLRMIMRTLQEESNNLASAGAEIQAAVAQQSSGVAEQGAAIAQTTATVDEVRTSAEQAVQRPETVSTAAREAEDVAIHGVQAIQAATTTLGEIQREVQHIGAQMQALSGASQRIGEIITAVADLADQSNLLSLNAAIEASRAGEHGRGFAVVAQEIRHLAEQSKTATAQVRQFVAEIQQATHAAVLATEQGQARVENGVVVVEQAGSTIDRLSNVVRDATEAAAQIGASVRQHAIGMEQIATAMSNINIAGQQNQAATSSTRQAADNLHATALRLTQLVARYEL